MEKIFAEFSSKEIELLHANLDELNEAGRVGNAHSIATLLDDAIKRASAKSSEEPESSMEKD